MVASDLGRDLPGATTAPSPPLIAHVILRLGIGGMENGLVNLINRMPRTRYRHAIVCLDGHTDFRDRLARDDVPVIALGKRAGKDLAVYPRLWRVLRRLRPAIVHTRNLPTVMAAPAARAAGWPALVHSEHGRDMVEYAGDNRKYNGLRRVLSPLVDRYIALSHDLEGWLVDVVGIPRAKVVQIYNGVDTERFRPRPGRGPLSGFARPEDIVIGTVGRMEPVKDQLTLARAFLALCEALPEHGDRLRLVMVGDGSLAEPVRRLLADAGSRVRLTGPRDDVPELLAAFDIFVLPSLNEGISNTILEAMACGLAVVATRVGGNPELVVEGETGALVRPAEPKALAEALAAYVRAPAEARRHGRAARRRVERAFAMDAMVANYLAVYDALAAESTGVALSRSTEV